MSTKIFCAKLEQEDFMKIITKNIPTKFVEFQNGTEVELFELLNTIEQLLDAEECFYFVKDYEIYSIDAADILVMFDLVEKKYGERQSIVYSVKNKEKILELMRELEKE